MLHFNRTINGHLKNVAWIQCNTCAGWLHNDCAGVGNVDSDSRFYCGCKMQYPNPFVRSVSTRKKTDNTLLRVNMLINCLFYLFIYL